MNYAIIGILEKSIVDLSRITSPPKMNSSSPLKNDGWERKEGPILSLPWKGVWGDFSGVNCYTPEN